jgi:hypothetical protein
VHPVGHGSDQALEDVTSHTLENSLMQLHKGELGRAVDGNQQVEAALLRSDLGDVDMEVADRVRLEPLLGPACCPPSRAAERCRDAASSGAGLIGSGVGSQPRDAVTLQAAVQA